MTATDYTTTRIEDWLKQTFELLNKAWDKLDDCYNETADLGDPHESNLDNFFRLAKGHVESAQLNGMSALRYLLEQMPETDDEEDRYLLEQMPETDDEEDLS